MKARVGFIGLGTMGMPMSRNIAKNGYDVVAYDVDRRRLQEASGGPYPFQMADSVEEVGRTASIVITMLPNPKIVRDVVLGTAGLLGTMTSGSLWMDMSTMDPILTQELAKQATQRGIRAIDAPVGRTSKHAEAGTLIVMAGGRHEDVTEATPVLRTMAEEIVYCGLHGMGQAMKVVNNLLATIVLAADCEVLVLGQRAGLSLDTMLGVFQLTAAQNGQLDRGLKERAFQRNFTPGFKAWLAEKDLTLAKDLARHYNIPLMLGSLTREKLTEMMAEGLADEDVSALLKLYERVAGVEVALENP